MREHLEQAGLRVVQTPYRAPNANAHAERFVRSMREECLDRLVPLGEQHLRRASAEYVAHYEAERPHQGRGNTLLRPAPLAPPMGRIRRRPRLGAYSTTTRERHEASADEWDSTAYTRQATTIPWEALALQIGSDYGRLGDFKAALLTGEPGAQDPCC